MMKQVIISSAKRNTVTVKTVDDHSAEWVDYRGEIDLCKHRLAQTDYVVIKIAEGAATKNEYAQILAERQELRAKINELERLEKIQQGIEVL